MEQYKQEFIEFIKILNSEIISVFTTMSTIWMYRVKTKYTQKPYH